MKRILTSLLAVCMVLSLCVCLSSCDWFDEEETSTVKILETPEATDFLALLNNGITEIITDMPEINYSSSVSIGGIKAVHPEGSTSDYDLATFDSAADYVKNLMMKKKPFNNDSIKIEMGSVLSNGLTVGEKTFDDTDIYLTEITSSDFFKITDSEDSARNWANENATDAEGKTITNSDGDVETVVFLADNNLLINITFNDVVEEKDDQGNVTKTTAIAPDTTTIEKYFGKPKAAAAITSEFNKTSDYLVFGDYSYEYSDCSLSAVINLTDGRISSLSFSKAMEITMPVTGAGTFAAIGDVSINTRATEVSSFSFVYNIEGTAENETTSAETTATAETSGEITEATTIDETTEAVTDASQQSTEPAAVTVSETLDATATTVETPAEVTTTV